jgi:hypothetical protein
MPILENVSTNLHDVAYHPFDRKTAAVELRLHAFDYDVWLAIRRGRLGLRKLGGFRLRGFLRGSHS